MAIKTYELGDVTLECYPEDIDGKHYLKCGNFGFYITYADIADIYELLGHYIDEKVAEDGQAG